MAGYSRQSVADIIANAVIKAAPVNAEYNAIRDAFAFSGGHKHDGSSTEGAYVPLIADTDALNKVVVDTTNNRISFYSEVSGVATEQVRIQDGAIVPVVDNDVDLGTSGLKFKNLYVDGIGEIGSVTILGGTIDNAVIGGTTPAAGTFSSLTATTADINAGTIDNTVIGATTPAAADFTTMDASGNATVGGTLGVTGVTTLGTANITSVDLNSGAIDSTTIGAATPAAGTFTTLTANTSLTAASADINGGTIDGTTIGATSASTGAFTTLSATGTSTLSTVDINAGNIDGTTIGSSSAAAGSFTTVSTSGQATLATVDINGGAIDGATIGASSPAAITGTTITATSFVGPVTGNVTGNLTGNVTGDLTGNVTGNITASSGSSTFNNVTINGTLNMDAATTATITNLSTPVASGDAASKGYVDTQVANLVDSAPGTLDTLNELAAALDDDPNFSTTITNSIATKLPLAGGTMTGAIAMSTNKITGLGDPTAAQDAMTKAYADSNYLALSGGTMTGAIDMGSAKITTTYTPTNAADLTTKTYVDGILGSATAAAASAAAAATSETNAATSETNAANSATAAASSATSAAASYDDFDDRYLGAKASAPTLDNDGDALVIGALYFNTTTNIMNVYGSSGWQSAGSAVNGTSDRQTYTATSGQTVFAATYDTGYVDVYLNGVKLIAGTDFTATNGTSITLTTGAALNDVVDIVAYGTFVLADHLTETQSDAKYVEVAGDTMTGTLNGTSATFSGDLTVDTNTLYVDSTNNRVGIGTASPKRHLHINDPSAVSTKIQITNSATGSGSDGEGFQLGIGSSGQAAIEQRENQPLTFSTNNTERMRIDSSGNLLVDTTSTSIVGSGGFAAKPQGSGVRLDISNSGGAAMLLDRRTNDGDIISFYKDGTTVGSIDTSFDNLLIRTAGNKSGIRFDTNNITPFKNGSEANGTVDLGYLSGRFKDLYLSGIAYANYVGSSGDTDTIIAFDTANTVRVVTAGSEAMRIESNGRMAIGKTSATAKLDIDSTALNAVQASATQGYSLFNGRSSGAGARIGINAADASSGIVIAGYNDAQTGYTPLNYLADHHKFKIGSSEKVRITDNGNLFINTQSSLFSGNHMLEMYTSNAANDSGIVIKHRDATGVTNVNAQVFVNNAGSAVGSIKMNSSSTTYNTSSDYRLKENVTDVTDGITRVKQLAPKRFNFIVNPDTTVDGFIAHEVQDVIPEAISGTKDAMRDEEYEVTPAVLDDDGNVVTEAVIGTRSVPDYQGIDQSKLVPLLTAALQEAIAKIETLETEMTSVKARLDALEAN